MLLLHKKRSVQDRTAAGEGAGVRRRCGRERQGQNMRKYNRSGQLKTVICNGCGRKLAVKDGILREGCFHADHPWDYFSEKDGEIHHFDLCEECYDHMIQGFHIPVEREEQIELL